VTKHRFVRAKASRPRSRYSQANFTSPQLFDSLQKDLGISEKSFTERYIPVRAERERLSQRLCYICHSTQSKNLVRQRSQIWEVVIRHQNFYTIPSDKAVYILRCSLSDLLPGAWRKCLHFERNCAQQSRRASTLLRRGNRNRSQPDNKVDVNALDRGLGGVNDFQCTASHDTRASQRLHPRDISEYVYSSVLCQELIEVASNILAREKESEQGRDYIGFCRRRLYSEPVGR
jgi:hypothetical protein